MRYASVEWKCLTGVKYQSYLVYENPRTGELAWESWDMLVSLPTHVENAIRSGVRGELF